MRTIQVHPFSLIVGAAVVLLAFVTMGQKQVQTFSALPRCEGCQAAIGPQDYVTIRGDETYVVPLGKDLVFTAVRGDEGISGSTSPQIQVDGVAVAATGTQLYGRVDRLAGGHVFAPSGSTVTWWNGTPSYPDADKFWIMGYLTSDTAKQRVMIKDDDGPYTVPIGKVLVPSLLNGLGVSNLSPWAPGAAVTSRPRMLVNGLHDGDLPGAGPRESGKLRKSLHLAAVDSVRRPA